MKKIKQFENDLKSGYQGIVNSEIVLKAERLLRKLILPGFDGMPLYDVLMFFIKGLNKGALTLRAAAFTYNSFLAIFPTIIFFFTIIPYIPINNFQENLMALLAEFIPESAFQTVETTVYDIVNKPRGGLLSLGFLLALIFSTNGIASLIGAFNQTYHSIETRPFIIQRLVAIVIVLLLSGMVILAIALMTIGPPLLNTLVDLGILHHGLIYYLVLILRWLVILALLFFAFSTLYYLAPAKKNKFRFISAGSTLATLLTILLSGGFNYYVTHFTSYNRLYGSIGTLMVIMLWLYFNGLIMLIGFELNASIIEARHKHDHDLDQNHDLSKNK